MFCLRFENWKRSYNSSDEKMPSCVSLTNEISHPNHCLQSESRCGGACSLTMLGLSNFRLSTGTGLHVTVDGRYTVSRTQPGKLFQNKTLFHTRNNLTFRKHGTRWPFPWEHCLVPSWAAAGVSSAAWGWAGGTRPDASCIGESPMGSERCGDAQQCLLLFRKWK